MQTGVQKKYFCLFTLLQAHLQESLKWPTTRTETLRRKGTCSTMIMPSGFSINGSNMRVLQKKRSHWSQARCSHRLRNLLKYIFFWSDHWRRNSFITCSRMMTKSRPTNCILNTCGYDQGWRGQWRTFSKPCSASWRRSVGWKSASGSTSKSVSKLAGSFLVPKQRSKRRN